MERVIFVHVNMTIAGKIATAEDAARYVEGGSGLSAIGGSAGGPTCIANVSEKVRASGSAFAERETSCVSLIPT